MGFGLVNGDVLERDTADHFGEGGHEGRWSRQAAGSHGSGGRGCRKVEPIGLDLMLGVGAPALAGLSTVRVAGGDDF
jgi:hypothetical protein